MNDNKLDKLCSTVDGLCKDVTLIKDNLVGNKLANIPSMIDQQREHHDWIEKQKNKLTVKKFFLSIAKAFTS